MAAGYEKVDLSPLHSGVFQAEERKTIPDKRVNVIFCPVLRWRMILKWIFRTGNGDMKWIDLARDWDRWRAFVKVVMKFLVPLNAGNSLTS
jgi:hypothetical protein